MAASGPGPPGDGVVKNSALSFVALAHGTAGESSGTQDTSEQNASSNQADRVVPAGLKVLYDACAALYPHQPNPLQVTTRLKYWLGGEDPLDYISMYWNPGVPEEQVPPHWHYVSFGLSDLHGDGRVHPPAGGAAGGASGFGLELTLRLAAAGGGGGGGGGAPPLWPAALLQALARYIFATGNKFCAGDHVSWHAPLDASATRVRHLLVADDARLPRVSTPHGRVSFLQLVGCTSRELRAAQRSSGFDVLKMLQEDPSCGGSWLVTHVSRRRSARRAPPPAAPPAAPAPPAHLAGVSCRLHVVKWTPEEEQPPAAPGGPGLPPGAPAAPAGPGLSPRVQQQIKDTLQRGLCTMSGDHPKEVTGHMSTDSFEMSSIEKALPQIPELMQGSWRDEDSVEYLEGVHLIMNPEGASLLPLAIDGRVLHDRHFTWRDGACAVTLVTARVAGALATPRQPYAARGSWLQILIPKELAGRMSADVAALGRLTADSESEGEGGGGGGGEGAGPPPPLPLALAWPAHKLKISVVYDHHL